MENKIFNENCLDTMKRMEDNSIDLVVTSPPYDNLRSYDNDIDKTWNESVWKPIISELSRIIKDGGVIVWVVNDATIKGSETGSSFKQALYFMECGLNLHDTMIWVKKGGGAIGSSNTYTQNTEYMFILTKNKIKTFNPIKDVKNQCVGSKQTKTRGDRTNKIDGQYRFTGEFSKRNNWWYCPPISTRGFLKKHKAIFPEKLVYDHIISWSNEDDIVYDPFLGSGTTAKVAKLLKRKYIGSEINSEYFEIAKKRIKYTQEYFL